MRGLIYTDPHIPFEDKRSMNAMLEYITDEHNRGTAFDFIGCLGDFLDFDFISSHNIGNLRENRNKSIAATYTAGQRWLDKFRTASPSSEQWLIEGNHDFRIERYLNEHPELEGTIEVPVGLDLVARGIEWIPYWQDKGLSKQIGKATFIHGLYTNDLHAKRHVLTYGTNVFYGHLHDFQQYSLVTLGDNNTKMGQSCGCMCLYDQTYMFGRPSRWQQGFVEFTFRPDGYFQYFPVMIFNNAFTAPGGKHYSGRRR